MVAELFKDLGANLQPRDIAAAYKSTYISHDYSPEELTRCRDVKAMYNLARSSGTDCLYKGSALVVGGVRYNYSDILEGKLINKGLILSAARTRNTSDGVAFSGLPLLPQQPLSMPYH